MAQDCVHKHNSQAKAEKRAARDLTLQVKIFQRHRLLHVGESNRREWHMQNNWAPWI